MVRGRCLTCLPTLHMYETSQVKIRCWRGGHHILFMSRSWESFERFRSLAEPLNCFNYTQASHHRLSTPSARLHPRSVTNSFVATHRTSRNIRSVPSIFQGRGVEKNPCLAAAFAYNNKKTDPGRPFGLFAVVDQVLQNTKQRSDRSLFEIRAIDLTVEALVINSPFHRSTPTLGKRSAPRRR